MMQVNCAILTSQRGETVRCLSDEALMEHLKAGDMNALEVIYERYRDMVEAAVRRVTPNVGYADVEELVHDIFIALIKETKAFDFTRRFKPWLYGIAVNKALGDKRRGFLHRTLLDRHRFETEVLGLSIVESPSRQVEIRRDLIRAFTVLPKEQHDVMILHAVEGFSGEEIADILGIKLKTVWTRLHRARKTLSAKMHAAKKEGASQ